MRDRPMIGREREQAELTQTLACARNGQGRLLLLAGEAGVGKTRLAEEALTEPDLLLLRAGASQDATPPYGPIVGVLRAFLEAVPAGFDNAGPLAGHLALLLPELGPPPARSDQATLREAIHRAFVAIARLAPTAIFLDDLQWADSATLDLLPAIAGGIEHEPLGIVGAYRSDEIPRGHPLRRMRTDLRRAGRLHEIVIEPLNREETALLTAAVLAQTPSPELVAVLYDRTQGVPFFLEELAVALATSGRLKSGGSGVELAVGEHMPIPDTLRDAVLLRVEGLSEQARRALEVAAVAGMRFGLDLVAELTDGDEALVEPIEQGLIVEVSPGVAAFRHALMREALYGVIPWPRRRSHHRRIAARLERGRLHAGEVAEHWLAAREFDRARHALLAMADASCLVHAYRDAAEAARRALAMWPENEDEPGRLALLDRLGLCEELCGNLTEAALVWQETATGYRLAGSWRELADVQRQLATVYELQGMGEPALAAHQDAAAAFDASGLPEEAATERIAVAEHLESAGRFREGLDLVIAAAAEADRAGRIDLKARTLGLEGELRADLGQIEVGLEIMRSGLALALDQNLTEAAAEIYYRLAVTLDQASDYTAARDAYATAIAFCQREGVSDVEQICVACLAVVLRQTGEWDRAISLCREVLAEVEAGHPAHAVAAGLLGSFLALRGERGQARRLLLEAHAYARRKSAMALEIDTAWSLAVVAELDGDDDAATERFRFVRERWRQTEDRHYAIPPLRWAATFFAGRGAAAEARACAHALAKIAESGNAEALAGLAHALGECALLEADAPQAALHFHQALDRLQGLDMPFARAQTQLRAGVALAAAGERDAGIERLTHAYRTARKLGARPLATRAAEELAALGEPVERRLGRRAAGYLERAGLSRREHEVLRLISLGRTNREIARELFLSPRTIEMYVGNILTKLSCSSRAEATHRAHELQLLA